MKRLPWLMAVLVCCAQMGCKKEHCNQENVLICHGGDLYWQGSCGMRGDLKEACAHGCDEELGLLPSA